MPSTGRRRGLRKLSPDFVSKARDETAHQVTRIGLTFLGTSMFCLLSLFTPDSALLGGNEKISVPLAGPVSFSGFMLLGPAVLIVLRVSLQIYMASAWSGSHDPCRSRARRYWSRFNPLIRCFSGLTFYLLLPLTMLFFAWKAAVFQTWGSGLLSLAVAVVVSHLILSLKKFSWRSKALLSAGAAFVAGIITFGFVPVRRPFNLTEAPLSGQSLVGGDLMDADLRRANLTGAYLTNAILRGANLSSATLTGADLRGANLTGANLTNATLRLTHLSSAALIDATLAGANLRYADLSSAYLMGAVNLTPEQLDQACGNADTKLPEGLTIKACQ